MKIKYTIKTGKNAGVVCGPHKTKTGTYIVSKTRFKNDYIEVTTLDEIKSYLERGFRVRVSGISKNTAPSLVSKQSLEITN